MLAVMVHWVWPDGKTTKKNRQHKTLPLCLMTAPALSADAPRAGFHSRAAADDAGHTQASMGRDGQPFH